MDKFALAVAQEASWAEAADACVEQLAMAGEGQGLGFLYVTDHLAPEFGKIAARMRDATGVADWVGSVGIGVCGTGQELFDVPGMVAMCGEFPPGQFQVFSGLQRGLVDLQPEVRSWCETSQPYFGVVHADPRSSNLPDLLSELSEFAGGGFLVGGLASSRRECPQLAGSVVDGGLSGVLFSNQVAVSTRLSQGCSPISGRHTITRAERNLIMELDGEPALDALAQAAGELLMRNPRDLGGRVFVGLPVTGSDTGDYMVRNLVGLDMQAGVLAVGDRVERGQSLLFCRRDAESAREDLERMVGELRSALTGPPKGGVYFSCLARGPNLFGPDGAEMRLIQEQLGDVPLAGFFANGEVSNQRLYAYTGVLALFS